MAIFSALFKNSLQFRIAKHALGKYIIGYASFLHLLWAAILALDIRAANATPLSMLFAATGNNRWITIVIFVFVALLGGLFLDLRLRAVINLKWLTLLLIPQQMVLLCSAGAGIYATIIQRYADGIVRSWAHIAADQSPVVMMAALYTVALLESTRPPASVE